MLEDKEPPSIVKNVMARPVVTVETGSPIYDAAKIMSEKGIGSVVVAEKGKYVGIVTERDIIQRVVAKGLDASKVRAKDIMSKALITVNGNTPIIKAIRIMEKNKVRRLLVVEKKRLVGIVTQRDLLRVLAFHVIISFRPLL